MEQEKKKDELRLADLELKSGSAEEMPAQDRARLTIAVRVLGALAIIFIMAGWVLIYGPECRLAQAKEVFEFVKTIAPPIATLVIGFYFRSESA